MEEDQEDRHSRKPFEKRRDNMNMEGKILLFQGKLLQKWLEKDVYRKFQTQE